MKKYYQIQTKSFGELGVSSYKELWEKVKETHDGISTDVVVDFEKVEKGFHAVFSSAKQDRHGDIVHQEFDLKGFKKNPVVLDSHNYSSIERIVGKVGKMTTKNGYLEGDIEFFSQSYLGALAEKMVDEKYLNAVSIGFIPLEFNDKGEILKSELLELSLVSVPAQAEALFKNYEDKCPYEDCEDTKEEDSEDVIEEDSEKGLEEEEGIITPEEDENPVEEQLERQNDELETEIEEEVDEKAILRSVVKELQKMREDNFQQKRRQLYKKIRDGLSQ